MTTAEFPPEEVLDRIFDEVNNAGRWGPDDALGTLNFISPRVRVAAATLVRSGVAVSISQEMSTVPSANNPYPVRHTMRYAGDEAPFATLDEFTVATHGYALTHLDALAHVYRDGQVYNGRTADSVVTVRGLTFGDVHAQRNGIFTRGVLLDVAAARGSNWLPPQHGVTVADLEAAEERAELTVRSGDAVFVRVGLGARERAEGPEDLAERAGIMPEVIPWLARRQVAVYSGDCVEKVPSPYPRYPIYLHHIGLAAMGLTLLDCP